MLISTDLRGTEGLKPQSQEWRNKVILLCSEIRPSYRESIVSSLFHNGLGFTSKETAAVQKHIGFSATNPSSSLTMGRALKSSAKDAFICRTAQAFTLLIDCWGSAKIGESFRVALWWWWAVTRDWTRAAVSAKTSLRLQGHWFATTLALMKIKKTELHAQHQATCL